MTLHNKQPACIALAGPIGSSKTPIATYLGYKLQIPVFSNDVIRKEVIEDLGVLDNEAYKKRRDERLSWLIKNHLTFIYSSSIDRSWNELCKELGDEGYRWFVISLDLSEGFVTKLCQTKRYHDSLKYIDQNIKEHEKFVSQYEKDINLHITDKDFSERITLSYNAVRKWL